jgi:hypothetical protein
VSDRLVAKDDVLRMMRRLGLHERLPEAERDLPEVVHLDRDEDLLDRLGLGLERIEDRLGGSP